MDSTALAYWKRPDYAITVDYGQAAAVGELRAAVTVANALNIPHEVIRVDCHSVGAGDMHSDSHVIELVTAPSEWWPFRNQLIVTLAAARAVKLGITTLLIGTVRSDDRFADGTAKFVNTLSSLLTLQEGDIRLFAPAIELSTVELVRTSGAPADLLSWSMSCHKSENACGRCKGCRKRAECWADLFSVPPQ